jgi:hypothetical protein
MLRIVVDTSNAVFAGTSDATRIRFMSMDCAGGYPEPREVEFALNPAGRDIKAGSSVTYTFADSRLKDASYVKKFTLEKQAKFWGHVFSGSSMPIPLGVRFSNDWKVKRVRVYFNGALVSDTNPSNSEAASVWLDKSAYYMTYPDPNTELPGPVCPPPARRFCVMRGASSS